MDTWLVVLLVVIAVVVVLVVALAMSRRSKAGQLRKQEQARADELRAKAQKIAPDVTDDRTIRDTDGVSTSDPGTRAYGSTERPVQREGYPDQTEGGATRR